MKRKTPAESLTRLAANYDTARKLYWILDRRKDWIEVTESSLRRHLKASGISPECTRDRLVSELDETLNNFQLDCAVSYAGPLAGYAKGIREVCGNRILVTTSPKLIEPGPGRFPFIATLLQNLFQDEVTDQTPYVKGWLKVATEAQRAGGIRPGQALAMAGPPNGGKSLLQNLITELLGGRAAKPYRYMSGATSFNGDLFGAEHLMIEDECASTDIRTRREFGARIKDFTVNEVQSCHAKNRQAISLRPFWRLSVSLNDEPEDLMILPPIDESLSDKVILLRTHTHPMPMDTKTNEGRAAFWQALTAELPAFLHHLLQWEIPASMRCPRFGVKTFHHPVLLDAIDALSPELRLLSVIDAVLFKDSSPAPGHYELTAEELERKLITSEMGYEARRLLHWNYACGTYLGRLATKRPFRVEHARTGDSRNWLIRPPGGNGTE
jgi:hypothetical protein